MTKLTIFIFAHLILLLLACTHFSLITALLGRSHFEWDFFDCTYRNGWGYIYQSDYSLPQVIAYLIAYLSGLILYPTLTRPPALAAFATLLCLVGVISFLIELSHWAFDHHLCLIASFPIVLLPISAWTVASALARKPRPLPA